MATGLHAGNGLKGNRSTTEGDSIRAATRSSAVFVGEGGRRMRGCAAMARPSSAPGSNPRVFAILLGPASVPHSTEAIAGDRREQNPSTCAHGSRSIRWTRVVVVVQLSG